MSKTLKTILIILGSIFLLGVLLLAALMAYFVIGDNKAEAKAKAFCQSAVVGASSAGVLEHAEKSGTMVRNAQWHKMEDGTEELLVVFPTGLPLAAYVCTISAKNGIITAAATSQID